LFAAAVPLIAAAVLWTTLHQHREALVALERGEVLAAWSVSPLRAERARRLGSKTLTVCTYATIAGFVQSGGILVLTGPKQGDVPATVTGYVMLAGCVGLFMLSRTVFAPRASNAPVPVVVGPTCAVVGRDLFFWQTRSVRLERVTCDEALPQSAVCLHTQVSRGQYGVHPGLVELPFEAADVDLARDLAARLASSVRFSD